MSAIANQGARPRRFLVHRLLALAPLVLACGQQQPDASGAGGSAAATTGGVTTSVSSGGAPSGGISSGGSVSLGGAVVTSGGSASGASAPGGSSALSGGAPATGAGGSSAAGTAASAQGGGAHFDHCAVGYAPHPSDDSMKDGPAEFYPPGKTDPELVDLTVQPEVIAWMDSHFWQAAHVEWHAIRTCALPGGPRGSKVDICQFKDMIPKDQFCNSPGDGYQFMLFHRHMLEALKQLWPKHTEQFTGFPKFPQSAEDVPAQWRKAWKPFNATTLANAKIADEIDKPENLAKFPTEGEFGFWLQCNLGSALQGFNLKSSGLHGDLHGHWIRQGNTEHGVGNTSSNIDNYMFWKLHGWMDNVWEKYRLAKGLKRTDPKYIQDLQAQCREMDIEAEICRTGLKPPDPTMPLPAESGFFHEKVRPIFESAVNKCSGCHTQAGPEAGLSLGGHISSKDIVAGLVNEPTFGGGQYKRVVPGKPQESWLYLKITAMATSCTPTSSAQCFTGPMPPSADGLATVSEADAAIVRQWILDGAKGP